MTNDRLGSDISAEITTPRAADLNHGDVLILGPDGWITNFVASATMAEELGVAIHDPVSEVNPVGEQFVTIETADGREFSCHRGAEVAVRRRITAE